MGRIPTPLVDTHLAFAFARTLMVAVRVGVFEALADGERSASDVAARCATAEIPTARLLHALVGMGYLRPGRADRIALTRSSRRWLTRASPDEVLDKVLFGFDEWRFVEGYEAYVREGRSIDMHASLGDEPPDPPAGPARPPPPLSTLGEPRGDAATATAVSFPAPTPTTAWVRYQRGLRAIAGVSAAEVARRTPVPRGARRMLDIGGAHGRFAAAILRRHPALSAEVLELAPAVAASADLLAAEGMGERLRHRVGDALVDHLGEGDVDVVFASQFNHHLDPQANARLALRVARALRPGGVYVIQDVARPADARDARRARLGALLDLYFGATSDAGTYTVASMRAWQAAAGLRPLPTRWLRTLPGLVQQAAVRP